MSPALAAAIYLSAAVGCLALTMLLLRWGKPVDGSLSPRLRPPGMEALVVATTTAIALLGLACLIATVLTMLQRAAAG